MGVEVRQTLEREYDMVLSMREVRQLTLQKLQKLSSSKSNPASGACEGDSPGARGWQQGTEHTGSHVWKPAWHLPYPCRARVPQG